MPRLAETDDRLAQISCMYIYISTLMQLLEGITFAYRYIYFELHNFSYIDINIWSAPHSKTKLNFQKFSIFCSYKDYTGLCTRDKNRFITSMIHFWKILTARDGTRNFWNFKWCAKLNHRFWHPRRYVSQLIQDQSFIIRKCTKPKTNLMMILGKRYNQTP